MLNYIQYDRCPKNYHSLAINTVNKCRKNPSIKDEERDVLELRFWSNAGHIEGRILRSVWRYMVRIM